MATVSKAIAEQVIKSNGYYEDDPRVVRVIRYRNFEGVHAYAIEYTQQTRYYPTEFVREPKILWETK